MLRGTVEVVDWRRTDPARTVNRLRRGGIVANCVRWSPNVDLNVDGLEVCGEQNSGMMSQRQELPGEVMRLQNRIAESCISCA